MPQETLAAQIQTLVRLGYPGLFSMSGQDFTDALSELGSHALPEPAAAAGRKAFVLVVDSPLAPIPAILPLALRQGKEPVEKLFPKTPADFATIPQVKLPRGEAYLLVDVDRGSQYLNVTPDEARKSIEQAGRSPLTIAEGVALLTHAPDILQPNNCFSLLASRCGDKRVPALWLSEGRPKLGWCWAGNPHTWLGSASCSRRVGSAALGSKRPVPPGEPGDRRMQMPSPGPVQ
jgi:hypothetical protein